MIAIKYVDDCEEKVPQQKKNVLSASPSQKPMESHFLHTANNRVSLLCIHHIHSTLNHSK